MTSSKEWNNKCKSSKKALDNLAVKARSLGMSYGEYQAYIYLGKNPEKERLIQQKA